MISTELPVPIISNSPYKSETAECPKKIFSTNHANYWSLEHNGGATDVVVVPSVPVEDGDFQRFPALEHYEERHLFTLLLLQYNTRVFFVTSTPLDPAIVKYYLSLLPSSCKLKQQCKSLAPACSSMTDLANGRLFNINIQDQSEICLGDKIAKKPVLIQEIKKHLDSNSKSLMLCYRTSQVEASMAEDLNVMLYGSDPSLDKWGSKSGSRAIFEEVGVPFGLGIPLTFDVNELARGIRGMVQKKDGPLKKVVVKLDQFAGGGGNALLDLEPVLKQSGYVPSLEEVHTCLANMQLPFETDTWESWQLLIQKHGVIAEEWFEGDDIRAPSVQGSISFSGKNEIMSTHEQLLTGQQYEGCIFPAEEGYRTTIQNYGAKVGEALAAKGVCGHYGVDFVVYRQSNGEWNIHAIEINLRYTGTTHPNLTMRLLTQARYDTEAGLSYSNKGVAKYYVETDKLHNDHFYGMSPAEFTAIIDKHASLKFDPVSQTGPVFHLMGALRNYAKAGVTCIADSAEAATKMLKNVEDVLAEETRHRPTTKPERE